MRAPATLLALALWLVSGPVAAADAQADEAAAATRQVLVTFIDRAIGRAPSGRPGSYRGGSGRYGTTTWSRNQSAAIARDHALRTVTEWPILSLGVHCVVYEVTDSRSYAQISQELTGDERVASVQPMNTFRVLASGDPYLPLQTSIGAMHVGPAHRWSTGRGVRIAVIDTGVDATHPDLAGQVEETADMTGKGLDAFAADVHGTAVAGVIAAAGGNGQGITGVAPDARLIALKACWTAQAGDTGAICNSLTLAEALDTAIRMRPQIVNLSLTGPQDPLISALLQVALDAGIVVVAAVPDTAAGGPDFSAGFARVLRVRSSTAATFAGSDALAAPGVDVLTTFPHGAYDFISGSSFAAAHVAGVVALLLEQRPDLRDTEIRSLLAAPADGPAGQAVDACAALALVSVATDCGTAATALNGVAESDRSPL